MITHLLLLAFSLAGQFPQGDGAISGTVINRTGGKDTPCRTTVVLRLQSEGQFVPFQETTSDAQGEFRFERLPLGDGIRYSVGANQDEVHYPGPRIALTAAMPHATVELTVYDAVEQPSPLVIKQYEITLEPKPGALQVTESMVVENPSTTSYVGKAASEGANPVTLQLSLPANVERTTFQEEFYGRRFSVADNKLVTGIPWTPGRRELNFTYVLPNSQSHHLWERPLDLPCSEVRVRVRNEKPDDVSCDLPSASPAGSGEVVFQSDGDTLPAGHVLRVAMGRLPVPWTAYGRWLAAATLLILVAAATVATIRRRRLTSRPAAERKHSPGLIPTDRRSRRTPGRGSRRKHDGTRKCRTSL
jgi:hypothetical protein